MKLTEIVKVLKKVCGKKSQALYARNRLEAVTPCGNLVMFDVTLDCDISVQLMTEDWERIVKIDSPIIRANPERESGVRITTNYGYIEDLSNYVNNTRASAFSDSFTERQIKDRFMRVPVEYFDRSLSWSKCEDALRSSLQYVHHTYSRELGSYVFTTNGHVLTAVKCKHSGRSVPQELVDIVLALLPKKSNNPEVYHYADAGVYKMGSMTYFMPKHDDIPAPPKVDDFLVPEPERVSVILSPSKLAGIISTAKDMGLDGSSCGLQVRSNVLRIPFTSKKSDARQEFTLPVISCGDTPTSFVAEGHHSSANADINSRLYVNQQYLLEALQAFQDTTVTMWFPLDNVSPLLIHNHDNQKTVIVMPLRS